MEQAFATPGRVLVVVENEVGLVAITARDGGTTHVSLEADTPGAVELVEKSTIVSRQSGGCDHVVVKIPHVHGMKFIRRNGVTVRIDVPLGSDVKISTASANVELNGSIGGAELKTASGDITADDVGDLRAKTASGDIEVGTVSGDLRMHSASGDLRCVRIDGSAAVSTTSGDIEIGSVAERIDVRATAGDVRLGNVASDANVVAISGDVHVLSIANGSANVRSVSGDVEVGIARGVTLSVDAETLSGTVHSEIALTGAPSGPPGDPKVALMVRSVSGNVRVERGVEAFVR